MEFIASVLLTTMVSISLFRKQPLKNVSRKIPAYRPL